MEVPSSSIAHARRLLIKKEYKACHAICMELLRQNPAQSGPYFLLGVLTANHNNFAKALELFQKARAYGHPGGEAEAQAARCMLALNRRDEAVAMAQSAAAQSPRSALTLDTIGVVLSRTGHHVAALDYYEAAVAAAPDSATYQYNLGAALQFVGKFERAQIAFKTCLDIDPQDSRALVALSSMTASGESADLIPKLERAWANRDNADADQALQLAHALARCYENISDPTAAMLWLAKGKKQKRATITDREPEDIACFAAAEALSRDLTIAKTVSGDGPIFIVGMPRTGTTLTDRILSSHSQIVSAGELSEFSVAYKRAAKTAGQHVLDPATLRAATGIDLSAVGQTYADKVEATLGITGRFTDKMPLNVFYAPIILSAIPTARIVCLRRHPADTVLSNYRQLFATSFSYYAYAYELEATARYVTRFQQLLTVFEETLPAQRFRILDYEKLVADQENETRNLLTFCGVKFEPNCLNFHNNTAPVATASATQVRKPLYNTSMGRWRRYRPALDPALSVLSAAGLITLSADERAS